MQTIHSKIIKGLFLMFLLHTSIVASSQIPPDIDLSGIQSKWLYFVEDSNYYIPAQPYITKYANKPYHFVEDKSHVYALSYCINHDAIPLYGFILNKISKIDGKLEWTLLNNDFSGNKYQEYISSIFVNNDGNIDLLGFVRLDTMFSYFAPSWPHYAYKPALVVKYTVDVENGKILSRQTSKQAKTVFKKIYVHVFPILSMIVHLRNMFYIFRLLNGIVPQQLIIPLQVLG